MKTKGNTTGLRRRLALMTTATFAVAVAGMAGASAATASASSLMGGSGGNVRICLVNQNNFCVSQYPNGKPIIESHVGYQLKIQLITTDNSPGGPLNGNPEGYLVSQGTENLDTTNKGKCIADTGGQAYWANCGDNGTVWITVPHYDGYYVYDRYQYYRGNYQVMTVNPLRDGSVIWLDKPQNPGSPDWQTFGTY